MKQKHFIDSHKGVTGLAIFSLIALHSQWQNQTAWAYLALHGTYGLLWVLKSQLFPDKQWEQPTSIFYGAYIWAGLTLYWITPWIITSQQVEAPEWYIAICIALYVVGIFFHFTADLHKYIALQFRPEHLIKTGLWARCRNPNYFGELLIYLGFSLLARHWLPLVVIAVFMIVVWFPNMRKKDRSLSRYPDFAAYKANSKLLIPYIF